MTTVIHMDTSEGDGIQTAPESVVDDACISTAPRAADSAVGYAFYREGGGARGQVKDEGDSAIFLDKQIEAVTAYELTSAALGRLPTRTAPADHHVQGICRADKMMSRAEASAIRTDLNKPFSKASAHQHDISLGSADHQPADIVVTSPRTPGSKHVYVGALTTLSPTSSRFQVPKLTPSQPVVEPATRLVPRTTPPKDEEIPALIHAKEQSLCGLKAYRQTDCEDSRDAVEVLSVREEEEEEDDDDDDVEDDVAARVLLSLHKKDDMIEQLMRTVATLQVENTSLRSRCAAAVGTEAAPLSPTMGTAVSPERTKTSSPSWPATPVRWWKLNRDVAPSDGVQEQSEGVQHLERGGAHADVKLRGTLADSEAGQAVSPVCDVTHREVQSSADTTEATTTPPLKNSAGESLASGIRAAPSASPSTEEETVARARIAQLEWQLENLQQEKREDTHVLRDHIDHLTRELHRRNRDMARQQRQHKLEFAALQEEVKALANQLDEQARSSTSVAAAAAAAAGNEPEDKEVMELRRQLAQARSRETQIRCDSAAMQQRWLQELNEQKSLLDEARTHAAQEETQHASMREHERQLAQVVAQQKQQQQQLEGQVSEYKAALAQAQRELAELRIAHQRTEETVSEQRSQIQCISHDLATAVLERTHHEQRATCVEAQVKLLQQQLRQAETTLSSQKSELETLRRERRNEVSAAFALQEEEHATLLKGVEGCMKGSEAVESALLKSERTRCEMASQLSRVLAERDEYHRLYREASVQSQAQLLEQQQLFSESSDLVCRQLQEAQRDLAHRTETLEMTQHELGTTQQRIESLRDELTRSKAAQRQLEEEREATQKRHESQTEQLVQAKESLKEALQAQLTTLDILRKKEKLLRAQHEAAQRTMERRQEEQHVLQNIADLLWPHEVNRVLGAPPPPPRILNSGAKVAPRDMPALSRSAIVVLKRNVSGNTRKSSRVQTRRSVCRVGSLFSVSNVDSESTVRPSRSTSSASSYATSVAMSAVSPTDALATPSTYGDAALNERQRSPSVALEENDAPANSGGSASAVVPLDPRFDSNLRAFELRQHQRPSGITHGREKQRGTIKAELPVLRFLRDIHGAVEQVCAAYASSQRELATKRAAVRALVKERKAQQAQLKELRATLQEQQHTSERLRRDAVQSVRAESQAKLTKVDEAWREKYGAGVALQLRSCEKQHRHAVAEALKACARHLQAELMAFVQRLPTTLSVGLARAAAASAESTRDKVLQKVRTQYERPHDTECAAHDDLGHHDSGAQGLHPRNAAAAADVSLLSLGLEVESEVQAECDVILRNVLGVTGGWEHLTSAVLLANNATALDHLSGTTPPSVASPAPQSYAFTHGSAVDDGSAPPGVELAQKIVVNAKRTSWTIEEMAELEEVIHAYLTRILSALTRTPSLSPLAGAVTCVSSSRDSDVRQDMEYHTRRAPTPFSGATSDIQSANSKGAAAREKSEEVLMTTALPRWMRPLGTSSPPYAPPLRSPAVEETATLPLPPHHQQPHLLGLLLDACVARVHEQLMV
ncbi:hypothetical protein JKF63_07474 [Porcisia hertigi]|uniref:Uncharacterized protein n=1 Tax=Porcisia hertigi TaxID=2761500 RepID=A0A836IHU7_9TRYP|nr:hypothetical protein JKF63_07474 [Porcisia hertigi]